MFSFINSFLAPAAIVVCVVIALFSFGGNVINDSKSAFNSKTGGMFNNSQSFDFNAKQNQKVYKSFSNGSFTDNLGK